MTSPLVVSKDVRARISSDHAVLRGLMDTLVAAARAAVRDEKQRPVVRELLAQFRSEVERHLDYEETALAPVLRAADARESERAETMAKEHEAQRATLVALAEDAEDGARMVEDLADEIRWFVRRFEEDMESEEQQLLTHDAQGKQAISAVQTET